MASELKLRRGTTAEHSGFVGAIGELTIDTTKDTAVVHDGATVGGFPLAKAIDVPSNAALAAGTGSSLVGYTAVDGGAVRSVQSKLRESVSVLDFQCDDGQFVQGNGIHDDTTGIQAALNATPNGTVLFPSGTYISQALNIPVNTSLQGMGLSSTVLKLKTGTNPAAFLQTDGFAALTGTTSLGGTFNSHISDLTIDGNKAGNTTGYALRLYGKSFRIINIRVQNAAEVGIYTEYLGGDDFTTPLKNLEATLQNVSVLLCGGTGMVNKGPHDLIVTNFISYSNGGWGWDVQTSVNVHHANTYTNTLGGIWAHYDGPYIGCLNGAGVVGSTGTGWGGLFTAGGINLSSSSFGGPIGLEITANNNNIQAVIANCSTSALKLNGVSASGSFNLTLFNNTGIWFDVAGASASSVLIGHNIDNLGTLQNGAFPAGSVVQITGAKPVYRVPITWQIETGYTSVPSLTSAFNTRKLFHIAESPQTGAATTAFLQGDRAINSAPSGGSPKGWICNISGTPGTWVSEGNL